MRVRVTSVGFINGSIVNPGDEIDVPEKMVSKKWMEPLEKPAPAPEKKPTKPAPAAEI